MTNIDACKGITQIDKHKDRRITQMKNIDRRITQMDQHRDKGITQMNIVVKELPR